MKSSAKTLVVGLAAGGLRFPGATAAGAATPAAAPTGTPVDCVAPALENPTDTLE